jgi:chromosome partitioning protein
MKTIAIINQKGGVGKSTTALSIGAGIGYRGHSVLFIDLDAQGNLSHTVGADRSGPGSIDVLSGRATAAAAVQRAQWDIIASSPALAGADTLITMTGKEYRLQEALAPVLKSYEYIVIDTPPALGILTVNALTACDGCLIPAQADIYSLQGISQLYGTIQTVQKYCNPNVKVLGILLTRYNSRAIIGREVAEMIGETAAQLGTKLFAAKIRECTAIKESQAVQQNILAYAPKSNAAVDYNRLLDELLKEE